jgi:CTP:molybdopterin cytidylyltransferase MocA
MTEEKEAALIPAAGRSSRMGTAKALLPLEGKTVIERIIDTFRKAGTADILVVVGHEARHLLPVLEKTAVRWVLNDRYDDGMFSSVQAGVRCLRKDGGPFFVHPVDVPLVRPETLRMLLAAFRSGDWEVCRPCFRGRRGHPPLLAPSLIPSLLEFGGSGGLRAFLSGRGLRSCDVECPDPGILGGMNTKEEYEEARRRAGLPPGPGDR